MDRPSKCLLQPSLHPSFTCMANLKSRHSRGKETAGESELGALGSNEGSSTIRFAFKKNLFGCQVENGLGKGQEGKQSSTEPLQQYR